MGCVPAHLFVLAQIILDGMILYMILIMHEQSR